MCESRAGNSCFLLTVGNFGGNKTIKNNLHIQGFSYTFINTDALKSQLSYEIMHCSHLENMNTSVYRAMFYHVERIIGIWRHDFIKI